MIYLLLSTLIVTFFLQNKKLIPSIWVFIVFIFLLSVFVTGNSKTGLFIAFWLNALILTLYFIDGLRINILTKPIFYIFKRFIPHISDTETEVLNAGDSWLEKEVFSPNIQWKKILNIPIRDLSNDEVDYLKSLIDPLCEKLDDWELVYENKEIPEYIIEYIKNHKLWGLIIPKKYGGLELSPEAQSFVISRIASKSVSVAITVMVPNSLGPSELIIKYGTENQKSFYLKRLAEGKEIPCFGLTSLEAGSDAGGIIDSGIVCKRKFQGKECVGIALNWNKRYITLSPISTLIGLAFKLYDPENLISKSNYLGITLALIPSNEKGVKIGKRHSPMGLPFPNGPIQGKDVFIPLDWVIGGQDYIGKGWKMLMECLAVGRAISLPSICTSIAKKCLLTTSAYGLIREQFNLPLFAFGGIQEPLARIAGFTYIMEATRQITASGLENGVKPSVASAIAKYHITELGRIVINDSMDIHGGKGIQLGRKNYLGINYMTLPISITVEGANILTRNLIIFGQGLLRCHPYLSKELTLMGTYNRNNIIDFEKTIAAHLNYLFKLIRNLFLRNIKNLLYYFLPTNKFFILKTQSKLSFYANVLALLSDISILLLGKNLKKSERISALLGDVLSYIYISFAVLRFHKLNENKVQENLLFKWSIYWLTNRINESLKDFYNLFPSKLLIKLIKWFTFPLGIHSNKNYSKLDEEIAKAILNSDIKKRLASWCHIGQSDEDPINQLLNAIHKKQAIASLLKKLYKHNVGTNYSNTTHNIGNIINAINAKDLFSKEEVEQLLDYVRIYSEVIGVDEFGS